MFHFFSFCLKSKTHQEMKAQNLKTRGFKNASVFQGKNNVSKKTEKKQVIEFVISSFHY